MSPDLTVFVKKLSDEEKKVEKLTSFLHDLADWLKTYGSVATVGKSLEITNLLNSLNEPDNGNKP